MKLPSQALFSGVAGACLIAGGALAQTANVSTAFSIHGVPGLIDMPTAQVAPDGALTMSYVDMGDITHGTLSFQITPRLSGSFRYSALTGYAPDGYSDPVYTDRNFDVSYLLLEEGEYLPAVSVGINDFIGTGLYSSEYVVATKTLFDGRLDVSAGLGWGRLASRGAIGTPFGARPPIVVDQGGTLNYEQWFRGPVAPFGGVSWRVNDKWTLSAEYSSDAYTEETAFGLIDQRSPLNFGAKYQPFPGLSFGAYYLYGDAIGFQVNITADPSRPGAVSGKEPAPAPVRPRPDRAADPAAWDTGWVTEAGFQPELRSVLADALARDGLILEAMSATATRAEIRIENTRYSAHPQAIGRAARLMSRAFPASVETFVVTLVSKGIPISSTTMSRSDVEKLEFAPAPEMFEHVQISDPLAGGGPAPEIVPDLYPRFTWSISPYMTIGLFDPQAPFRADVGLRFAARYELAPGMIFSGSVIKKLAGNLDEGTLAPDQSPDVPNVRSEALLYAQQGDPSIERLTFAWYGRPGRNLYSRVTVGYLEPMFAGVSAELLWKPVDSRLAFGAEINAVQQRDYDQMFGLRDYQTITGHVSAYYDFENGFRTQLDVGRYLAGDYGATLSVDRVFANGWKVGAFVTFTDLPADQFGEGSFDKGIRISIPMEWGLGRPTRAVNSTELRSLSSDGGARLDVDGRLFDWVAEGHEDALADRWGKFWR